jgi:hypothetical protein
VISRPNTPKARPLMASSAVSAVDILIRDFAFIAQISTGNDMNAAALLEALRNRPGGDEVRSSRQSDKVRSKLPPGVHAARVVKHELIPRGRSVDYHAESEFYRVWRYLFGVGVLETIGNRLSARRYGRLTGKDLPELLPVTCRGCCTKLPGAHRSTKWCDACATAAVKQRREAVAAERLKRRKADRAGVRCKHCSRNFDASRADALYCSPACSQAAYRRRLTRSGRA